MHLFLSYWRTGLFYTGVFVVSTALATFAASMYLRTFYTNLFAKNLAALHTGISTYSTYVRIYSVDPSLRAILAETRSVHADQTVITLAMLAPDFYMEKDY